MSYFWQGQWGELYMGDGMKHEDITYFPVQPPTIMEDPSERSVHEEVSTYFDYSNNISLYSQTLSDTEKA